MSPPARHRVPLAMILSFQIAAGANVDMVTEENASALTVAAYYGKRNSVLRLLKANADTTVMNGLHKTPADVATSQGNSGIANVIRVRHS